MVSVRGGNRLSAALQRMTGGLARGDSVQVGFFETETYPDGTSVAMVAAIQDFGAPRAGIPPRPFFRNTIADHRGEWSGEVARLLRAEDYNADAALAQMGALIVGEIQDSIESGTYAPLKPATAARKGFDKPLIDTARMLRSVSYKVKS
jgi:hypothetical protein